MNQSSKCLNCDNEISGNFCCNCGQNTKIQRISIRQLLTNDLFHGLFHLDKGMLFTAKEALTRPGKAALDYIDGKRVRYYNVFYFILLLIGLNIFVSNYYNSIYHLYLPNTEINSDFSLNEKKDFGEKNEKLEADYFPKIRNFIDENEKILIFCFVPLFAINGYLLFRKRNLNFSEHFIIAGITFLGILLLITYDSIFSFFEFTKSFSFISSISSFILPIAIIGYTTYSYYQTFKYYYKKVSFSFRMFIFITLLLIELIIFLFIIIGYSVNWNYKTLFSV
jgi:hypothetical protein